jgi:hypothetical protein
MNRLIRLVLIFIALASPAFGQKSLVEVNGEVFIVTKGGNNIKLGLVTVYFFTPKQLRDAKDTTTYLYRTRLEQNRALDSLTYCRIHMERSVKYLEFAVARLKNDDREGAARMDSLSKEEKIKSTLYDDWKARRRTEDECMDTYIEEHKDAIICDITNSDAKFKVKLKKQKYYVMAKATRHVVDEEEKYEWFFDYVPNDKLLILSNNNML